MAEIDAAFRSMIEENNVTKKSAAIHEIKQEIHEAFQLESLRINYKQEFQAIWSRLKKCMCKLYKP